MSRRARAATLDRLEPEKVAYWYLRLNGFLQLENFVVHPERYGSQRTDADLLAVRFPFRAERLFDDPEIMVDDEERLGLCRDLIDIVIAEVKTNAPCTLNGPWTQEESQNVHRVLAAIGCLSGERIGAAARDVYRDGVHRSDTLRVRLVAVGRDQNEELKRDYPQVTQLLWAEVLAFIWDRFDRYRRQKTQVDQWSSEGQSIKDLADRSMRGDFITDALRLMGVRERYPARCSPERWLKFENG